MIGNATCSARSCETKLYRGLLLAVMFGWCTLMLSFAVVWMLFSGGGALEGYACAEVCTEQCWKDEMLLCAVALGGERYGTLDCRALLVVASL